MEHESSQVKVDQLSINVDQLSEGVNEFCFTDVPSLYKALDGSKNTAFI